MITGLFASDQSIVGDRVGDFAGALLRTNPTGSARLLALSAGMTSEPAKDTIVTWFEEAKISGRTTTASGGTTTTVVVGDGSSYTPGVTLLVEETGEHILVTAVSGDSLTVLRGISGTAITSIDNTMHVVRIGNAHEEGSNLPVAMANQGKARYNMTQIFRNAWAVTGTTKAVTFHTGNKVAKNKRDAGFFHAEDMERALWFSKMDNRRQNGRPLRMMDGVVAQISKYGGLTTVQGNDVSYGELMVFLQTIFETNIEGKPNERIAFAGNTALRILNRIAQLDANYEFGQGETKFGLKFNELITPFGDIKLMTHPLFNEHPVWTKNIYVLHPGGIKMRWLRRTNEEGYDSDGKRIGGKDADEGVITSELSIELGAPSTMGIFSGLDTAVATGSET